MGESVIFGLLRIGAVAILGGRVIRKYKAYLYCNGCKFVCK